MSLPAGAAEKQNILDLMRSIKEPRYDSVMSTEGDLGSHPDSRNKDSQGRRMCDIMHPRLRARAQEWSKQYVVFETQNSYPMYLVTLIKTQASPFGPQQLIDAGCDVERIKALGFTARNVMDVGKTVRDMRNYGWSALDLKNAGVNSQSLKTEGFSIGALTDAGFDAGSLLAAGYTVSDMKSVKFTASQLKDAGCSVKQLKTGTFSLQEMKDAGFDAGSLLAAGYTVSDMKSVKFTASQLKDAGCSVKQLKTGTFSLQEMKVAGFDAGSLLAAGYSVSDLKSVSITASQLKDAGCSVKQLKSDFALGELKASNYDLLSLYSAEYSLSDLRGVGFSASSLKAVCNSAKELKDAGFTASDLKDAGFKLADLDQARFPVNELKSAGFEDLEISHTATNAITEVAMQNVEKTFAALNFLGARDAFNQRHAEDTAGTDFFKRVQVRAAIDDLVAALGHPLILEDDTAAHKLRAMQVKAWLLLAAGFSQPHLVAAGYSTSELSPPQSESSLTATALLFFFKHWKVFLFALLLALISISIGLWLGDVISMIMLVVCIPNIIIFLAHWICMTRDVSNYPVKWAIGFAAYFAAVFSMSIGIMLGTQRNRWSPYSTQATLIIFAVCAPFLLSFVLHYVMWSSKHVGTKYPFKWRLGFAVGFACVFALSLGLIIGLPTYPQKVSCFIQPSDLRSGKSKVSVTLSFIPSFFCGIPPGGTITLSYPEFFFMPSVTPTVAAGGSSVAGLTATCGETTATSVVITTAGAAIPSLSAFTVTLSGLKLGYMTAGGPHVTVQTSSELMASQAVESGSISLPITDMTFFIMADDRKAGKMSVPVTVGFTVLNTVPPGGTITLTYPSGFFMPSVTPAVAAGGSSVAGLTATCGETTATSVVITTAGAAIPSSSVFVFTMDGLTLGALTAGKVGITVQTSTDLLPSDAVESGRLCHGGDCFCDSGFSGDGFTCTPSRPGRCISSLMQCNYPAQCQDLPDWSHNCSCPSWTIPSTAGTPFSGSNIVCFCSSLIYPVPNIEKGACSTSLAMMTQSDLAAINSFFGFVPIILLLYVHRTPYVRGEIWRVVSVAAALISMCIGLWLGDVISMMVLVVCIPAIVMWFWHWKIYPTQDVSKYPVKYAVVAAAFFACDQYSDMERWLQL
jgi:uncharacterized protein YjbI with pentapeptide repeats